MRLTLTARRRAVLEAVGRGEVWRMPGRGRWLGEWTDEWDGPALPGITRVVTALTAFGAVECEPIPTAAHPLSPRRYHLTDYGRAVLCGSDTPCVHAP